MKIKKKSIKMRNIISYKIITLFLILIFTFAYIFLSYMQDKIEEDKMREVKSEKRLIKSKLMEHTLRSTTIFLKYHDKVFTHSEYIDPQSYLSIVRDLSDFVDATDLEYIKSYIKVGDKFLLTATSATHEEFRAKGYETFSTQAKDNIDLLSKAYNAKSAKEIFLGRTSAIQLQLNNHKYIIVTKIKANTIEESYSQSYYSIAMLLAIFLPILVLLLWLLRYIHKEILAIDTTLKDFFNYMLGNKKIEEIRYIENISGDQLGKVSQHINDNIRKIINMRESRKKREQIDEKVVSALIVALEPTLDDSFAQEVTVSTDNKNLNTLKNIVNKMIPNIDTTLADINVATTAYLNKDYIPSLDEKNYKNRVLELVKSLNQLGRDHSTHLMYMIENLVEINSNTKFIETHIENSNYTLNDILDSTKKILHSLEGDYKFAFEFDNSIKVIKKENVYVNNLLDKFGNKYEKSIALIDDLKSGLFDNNEQEFIRRIDSVIKDSSIRDNDAQKILIDRVRALTSENLVEASTEKTRGLLRLLLEELLKDIRYSLYLIETKVEKLASDSSARLSSFKTVENISKDLRDMVMRDLENIHNIQEFTGNQINKTDDIKYEIIENSQFIGKKEISRLLLQKGEL